MRAASKLFRSDSSNPIVLAGMSFEILFAMLVAHGIVCVKTSVFKVSLAECVAAPIAISAATSVAFGVRYHSLVREPLAPSWTVPSSSGTRR
ncbi:hypothetical protein D3C71_1122000 [compost metagenome]